MPILVGRDGERKGGVGHHLGYGSHVRSVLYKIFYVSTKHDSATIKANLSSVELDDSLSRFNIVDDAFGVGICGHHVFWVVTHPVHRSGHRRQGLRFERPKKRLRTR
jgi:hypothetical protein